MGNLRDRVRVRVDGVGHVVCRRVLSLSGGLKSPTRRNLVPRRLPCRRRRLCGRFPCRQYGARDGAVDSNGLIRFFRRHLVFSSRSRDQNVVPCSGSVNETQKEKRKRKQKRDKVSSVRVSLLGRWAERVRKDKKVVPLRNKWESVGKMRVRGRTVGSRRLTNKR